MKKPKYDYNELIMILKNIYNLEGIKGLISENLYNKYKLEFYIRKYKKNDNYIKKNSRGYPDEWCCQKVNILDERKEYLKKTFPYETDTFEELCEIHISPIIKLLIEKNSVNGYSLTDKTFQNNNHCDIVNTYHNKFKKGINDVRLYFKLPINTKVLSLRDEIFDSISEAVFDNFVNLYTNNQVNIHGVYPDDFIKKYSKECLYDFKLKSKDKRDIIVEIWMYEKNKIIKNESITQLKKRENYLEVRKIKEEYWKNNNDTIFIGIEYKKLYYDTNIVNVIKYLTKLLSPHIDILDTKKEIPIILPSKNEYEKLLDYCKNIMDNNEGYLYGDKISNKMRKKITKCGGICEIRKKLHGDKYYVFEKKYKERGNKLISDKRLLFSEKKKKEINIKRVKTLLENHNGVNHMVGKKFPPEDYKEKYCPLVCEFLQSLDKGDKISGSCKKWLYFSKSKKIASNPWNNLSEYNPWKETRWIGFIESGIEYANENNVVLPEFKYKNVVSTEKKYKIYTEEDIWKAHIDCINNYNGDKITKLYSNNYFKTNYKNLPNLNTLLDKNNERNNKIYSSTYDEFLIRTYKFAKENNINIKTIKYGKKIYN